jgi:hypothetical protein
MKDKDVLLSSKLVKYINPTNLFVFSKIVDSKRVAETHKTAI